MIKKIAILYFVLLSSLIVRSQIVMQPITSSVYEFLDEMAQMLIERETIDTEDIQDLLNRSEVKVANYI